MKGCEIVCVSPDRPNVCYEVRTCTNIENDFKPLVKTLLAERNRQSVWLFIVDPLIL